MDVAIANRFFALMTLAALTGVLGMLGLLVAGRFSPGARRLRGLVGDLIGDWTLWLAWLVAAVSLLGSLYYSEVEHLPPCSLCWYQRIAMYPLAVILLIAAYRRDRAVRTYALPLVGIGGLIAAYQYVLGYMPDAEVLGCSIDVSCTERFIWEFGFVDFPFMSLVAFAAIACLLACFPTPDRDER
jgi:disulfide bond formation protein DsbB